MADDSTVPPPTVPVASLVGVHCFWCSYSADIPLSQLTICGSYFAEIEEGDTPDTSTILATLPGEEAHVCSPTIPTPPSEEEPDYFVSQVVCSL